MEEKHLTWASILKNTFKVQVPNEGSGDTKSNVGHWTTAHQPRGYNLKGDDYWKCTFSWLVKK